MCLCMCVSKVCIACSSSDPFQPPMQRRDVVKVKERGCAIRLSADGEIADACLSCMRVVSLA